MLKKLKFNRKSVVLLTSVVILGISGFLFLQSRKSVSEIPSQTIDTSVPADEKQASSEEQPSSQKTDTADNAQQNTTAELVAPSGTFVSNHHPNLSGSPAPSKLESMCRTTPGATCYIEFSKGNRVKKLQSQTTNSDGYAYWIWDIKEAGLTEGEWTITAVAQLNGQNEKAEDELKLEVRP